MIKIGKITLIQYYYTIYRPYSNTTSAPIRVLYSQMETKFLFRIQVWIACYICWFCLLSVLKSETVLCHLDVGISPPPISLSLSRSLFEEYGLLICRINLSLPDVSSWPDSGYEFLAGIKLKWCFLLRVKVKCDGILSHYW